MPETPRIEELFSRLKFGDQLAAQELFERYATRLVSLARSRINQTLTSKLDPEDVVQSVFKSFFCRQSRDEFEVVSWDSLWGLLALITVRKCKQKHDHFQAERRGAGVELTLASLADESNGGWEPIASDPTPSQVMMLQELLEKIFQQLSNQEQTILALKLQGLSVADVAAQVLCSERTVQRTLKYVRTLAKKEQH